ncbi:S1 family peptidase [Cohnella fermenti]|uniref:Serine protease n=1 Tax=Cohnella fermenti TaxID=2565925 RepID=A0A4S4C7N5_9BACL|nr:serine protease [Cohnella fermenti]THF83314.1 trypsin-like peptidase domain-containing protein [Cohnella fermenti]
MNRMTRRIRLAKWTMAIMAVLLAAGVLLGGRWEAMDASAETEMTAAQLYESRAASVFYLKTYKQDGTLKTVGSGFLIGGGQALTAAHVVKDGAAFEAVFDDGTTIRGLSVARSDEELDVAVLNVSAAGRKALELAADDAGYGQRTYAMGYPLKETKIVTEGIVNAPAAKVNGVARLLTSAQIASGMSGGPLFDRYGRVAGIISGSFRTMDNIHLCASASQIRQVLSMEAGK